MFGWLGGRGPTVFHITHWKAGSQWIYAILRHAFGRRVVRTRVGLGHVRDRPIRAGKVYPCVYLPREEFEELEVPGPSRRFVIIRDLRDVLVSNYFSLAYSHPLLTERHAQDRDRLRRMTRDEGLQFVMRKRTRRAARIVDSWMGDGERVFRYEDLVRDERGQIRSILEHCGVELTGSRIDRIIDRHSFEAKTGRKRGEEDVNAHCRRGIVGEWKEYFTDEIKAEFKERFGGTLIRAGYEKDDRW
jgi:lipopolysaccharide transport system ATP-binding protein